MFESLFELAERVKTLDSNKFAVSIWFDKDIQKFILRANRVDQLTQGINADNELIGTYSPITDITYEGQKFRFEDQTLEKIAFEPYNFVVTGAFFRSFEVVVYEDSFQIIADTQKEGEDLADKFGKNILGLTQQNINELSQKMLPLFIDHVRKQIFS